MKFLLTGGRQRVRGSKVREWEGYDRAVVLELDTATRQVRPFFDYETPRDCLPEDPNASVTFKSCTIAQDHLLAATQTEILKVSLRDGSIVKQLSLPCFNDVHHVFVNGQGNYVVTSTGLDAVFEVDDDGQVVNEWDVLGGDIWDRFDRSTDYRKVLTTKPHQSHPNHCVEIDGDLWVTRLGQKDFTNLRTWESISIPFERPHDGLVLGDDVFFTHVNGVISRVNMPSRSVHMLYDSNEHNEQKESLGWCRGIWTADGTSLLIGYTRIRPTKYEESLEWVKRRLTSSATWYGCFPTRIACIDVVSEKVEWEVDTEQHGINAVFSILPLPEPAP